MAIQESPKQFIDLGLLMREGGEKLPVDAMPVAPSASDMLAIRQWEERGRQQIEAARTVLRGQIIPPEQIATRGAAETIRAEFTPGGSLVLSEDDKRRGRQLAIHTVPVFLAKKKSMPARLSMVKSQRQIR